MDAELRRLRLKFALEQIDQAISDLEEVSYDDFKESQLLGKATSFSIVQIGEQLHRLRDFYEKDHPEIEWDKSNGMRNLIVHDYMNVRFDRVYTTVKEDLPKLKEQLMKLLEE